MKVKFICCWKLSFDEGNKSLENRGDLVAVAIQQSKLNLNLKFYIA